MSTPYCSKFVSTCETVARSIIETIPQKIFEIQKLIHSPMFSDDRMKDLCDVIVTPPPTADDCDDDDEMENFDDAIELEEDCATPSASAPASASPSATETGNERPVQVTFVVSKAKKEALNSHVPANDTMIEMNEQLKCIFIDMVEDAMAISTWMYGAMPNPEDGNESWVDLIAIAMETSKWADLQLDNLVRYHCNRSHNVKQLLEAIDSAASEWRIEHRKRAIMDDDRRHFQFMRQQLRSAQSHYFVLHDQFKKNEQRFQTATDEACDRNFYM